MISIIIPAYNTSDYIIETLYSIKNQDYIHFECIVVDDYSDDDTFLKTSSFCDSDSRFRILHRLVDLPKGANSCRLTGYRNISNNCEYVLFFDSDDIMLPTNVSAKINVLVKNEKLNCCFSVVGAFNGLYNANEDYTSSVYYKEFNSSDVFWDFARFKLVFYYINGVFKRQYLDQNFELNSIEFYIDPKLPCYQDYYLFLMLINDGFDYATIAEPLVLYRNRPGSISSQFQEFNSIKSRTGIATLINIRDRLSFMGLTNLGYDLEINANILRFSRLSLRSKNLYECFTFFKQSFVFLFLNRRDKLIWKLPIQLIYILTGRLERYLCV